jgi:hypothetical protein
MRMIAMILDTRATMGKPSGSSVVRLRSPRKPWDRNILRWRRA